MILNSMDGDAREIRRHRSMLGATEIRACCASHPPANGKRFEPGRLVRICGGAFAGVEGAVLEGRENFRSIIALSLSQSGVYLEVDDALLEAIE